MSGWTSLDTKILDQGDKVRVMFCVNGQDTLWVLNLVGPVKRIDRGDDNGPRTRHYVRCLREVYQVMEMSMFGEFCVNYPGDVY